MTRIRLIKKLAPVLNDIDLSHVEIGDFVFVPEAVAAMLIREGWAEIRVPLDPLTIVSALSAPPALTVSTASSSPSDASAG